MRKFEKKIGFFLVLLFDGYKDEMVCVCYFIYLFFLLFCLGFLIFIWVIITYVV